MNVLTDCRVRHPSWKMIVLSVEIQASRLEQGAECTRRARRRRSRTVSLDIMHGAAADVGGAAGAAADADADTAASC